MKRHRFISAVLGGCALAGLLLSATRCSGMARRKTQEKVPASDIAAMKETGLIVSWHAKFTLEKNEKILSIHNGGGLLIAITDQKRVIAMNADSGVNIWTSLVAEPFEEIMPPAFHREMVYIATGAQLYGFRARDGRKEFHMKLKFSPSGTMVSNGRYCYMPASSGWFQAVALPGKAEKERRMSWDRWTPTSIMAGAAFTENRIFFADGHGTVYYSVLHDRETTECFKADGAIEADLKIYKNYLVLVPSVDYLLYALDVGAGKPVWVYYASNPIHKPTYIKDDQIFVLAEGEGIVALDAKKGKRQWQVKRAVDFIAADKDTVLAAGDNKILAIRRKSGKVAFEAPIHKNTMWAHNEIDGVGYLSSPGGDVVAVKAPPPDK